ncbi:MAG: glycosyltransferase family 39 protein [bacterium]
MTGGINNRGWLWNRQLALAGAGLVFLSFLYLSTVRDQLGDFGGDACTYIMLAENIAEGRGYEDPSMPGHFTHTKYPFMFPLLLSPVVAAFGRDLLAVRIETALMGVLSVMAWGAFFFRSTSRQRALALTVLFAIHPYTFSFLTRTLSETPFLFFTGLCLYLFHRYEQEDERKALLFCIGIAAAAYLTRTAALPLLGALVLAMVASGRLRRRRIIGRVPDFAPMLVAFAAVVLAWSAFVALHPNPSYNYFQELSQVIRSGQQLGFSPLLSRITTNLNYYSLEIPRQMVPVLPAGSTALPALAIPVWALIGWGMVSMLREKRLLEPAYFLAYAVMVAVWPPHLDFRFFYPLLPLFLFFMLQGLPVEKEARTRRRAFRVAFALLCLFLLGINATRTVQTIIAQHTPDPYPPRPAVMFGHQINKPVIDWSHTVFAYNTPPHLFALGEFIVLNRIAKDALPADSVIAGNKPRVTTFYTGKKAVQIPLNAAPEQALEFLASWKVDYIIADRFSAETKNVVLPLLRKNPELFEREIGKSGKIAPAIYRFSHGMD